MKVAAFLLIVEADALHLATSAPKCWQGTNTRHRWRKPATGDLAGCRLSEPAEPQPMSLHPVPSEPQHQHKNCTRIAQELHIK